MEQKRIAGISGSTLKIIAIITMFVDHAAATILARILIWSNTAGKSVVTDALRGNAGMFGSWLAGLLEEGRLYDVYHMMRDVGRIAFPIFCFLLVEGFMHTRNRLKYALRLGVFALVSEIPFDLAFSSRVLEFEYQNVFFTLFIGVLTMLLYQKIEELMQGRTGAKIVEGTVVMIAGMCLAELLRTDYGALGVLVIMVQYLFRQDRKKQAFAGALSFCWWELPAVIAFLPILSYNGKRGINLKYIFYIFYPAHLLLLYLICRGMGMGEIPAL